MFFTLSEGEKTFLAIGSLVLIVWSVKRMYPHINRPMLELIYLLIEIR